MSRDLTPVRWPSGPASQAEGLRLARRALEARALALRFPGGPTGAIACIVLGRAQRRLRRHIDAYGPVYYRGYRLDAGHGHRDQVAADRPLRTPGRP
jgi:hypothetical protein